MEGVAVMAAGSKTRTRTFPVTRVYPANAESSEFTSYSALLTRDVVRHFVLDQGDRLFCDVCGDDHEHCPDLKAALS